MDLARPATLFLLISAALLSSGGASACKIVPHHPGDYFGSEMAEAVVFRGVVSRVRRERPSPLSQQGNPYAASERIQDIEFRVTQWWVGARPKKVVVQGSVGGMKGTSCEGSFDFRARPGEEWVIFGNHHEGHIAPDKFVSVQVVGGEVPAKVREVLDKHPPQTAAHPTTRALK